MVRLFIVTSALAATLAAGSASAEAAEPSIPCVARSGALPPGALVGADPVETGLDQPAELALVGSGLVRLGPQTELRCAEVLELVRGRAWVLASHPIQVRAGAERFALSAGTSAIFQSEVGAQAIVVVIAGSVSGRDGLRVEARSGSPRVVRGGAVEPGGEGLLELFERSFSRGRWSAGAARAVLLDELRAVQPERPRPGPTRSLLRGDAETFGSDGGAAGRLLEAGVRPDPFGED